MVVDGRCCVSLHLLLWLRLGRAPRSARLPLIRPFKKLKQGSVAQIWCLNRGNVFRGLRESCWRRNCSFGGLFVVFEWVALPAGLCLLRFLVNKVSRIVWHKDADCRRSLFLLDGCFRETAISIGLGRYGEDREKLNSRETNHGKRSALMVMFMGTLLR